MKLYFIFSEWDDTIQFITILMLMTLSILFLPQLNSSAKQTQWVMIANKYIGAAFLLTTFLVYIFYFNVLTGRTQPDNSKNEQHR